MKILILSSRIPYPLTAGFRIRIYHGAKRLKEAGHQLDLLFLSHPGELEKCGEALREVFTNIYAVPFSRGHALCRLLGAVFRPELPFQVALYQNAAFSRKLREIHGSYDRIIANHIRTAKYLDSFEKNNVILDLHDAISYNYKNAIHVSSGLKRLLYQLEYRRVLSYECRCTRLFPNTVLISENDRQWLSEHGADVSHLHLIPLAVRDDIPVPKKDYSKDRHAVAFLGKMSYQPNADAVRWFMKEVFPKLLIKEPELQFYIIGVEPPRDIQSFNEDPNVTVTGFLEDPFRLLSGMKLSIVPIRNGAGTQNKLLESMKLGVPVIASPIASSGIGASPGQDFLVADTPEDYVGKIEALLHSAALRESIGQAGKRYVEQNYSWEHLIQKWLKLLQDSGED